jgi:hypothetical protein
LDEEGERKHAFYEEEEVIDSVDGSLFEVAIFVGDVIASEKDCGILVKEFVECNGEMLKILFVVGGEREVERDARFFNAVDCNASGFKESVEVVAF